MSIIKHLTHLVMRLRSTALSYGVYYRVDAYQHAACDKYHLPLILLSVSSGHSK